MTMNKDKLISAVSKMTGIKKQVAGEVIQAALESVTEILAAGNNVSIRGFGNLECKIRKERTAHSPKTGEPIQDPKRRAVVFHAGKGLKAAVSSK